MSVRLTVLNFIIDSFPERSSSTGVSDVASTDNRMSGDVEGVLAVLGIDLHSPRPGIKLIARGITKECCDVSERRARLSQRVDQFGLAELTRGGVPVAGRRIDRRGTRSPPAA